MDEPLNGYQSDFDLLVIVNHENLTDIADYWWAAEDRLLRDPAVDRTVNIIVHTLAEVNQSLERGEYFWTDIQRDGVKLTSCRVIRSLPPGRRPRWKPPVWPSGISTTGFQRWMTLWTWLDTATRQTSPLKRRSTYIKP